jgi:hypothetical protein
MRVLKIGFVLNYKFRCLVNSTNASSLVYNRLLIRVFFNSQLSTLNPQFSILNYQFPILNSQFPIDHSQNTYTQNTDLFPLLFKSVFSSIIYNNVDHRSPPPIAIGAWFAIKRIRPGPIRGAPFPVTSQWSLGISH